MTKSTRKDSVVSTNMGAKLVLGGLLLGLVAMLASVLAFRLANPSLLRYTPAEARQQNAAQTPVSGQPQGQAQPLGETGQNSVPAGMAAMMGMSEDDPAQAEVLEAMQALQSNATDVEALLQLADLFLARGDMDTAQNFVSRALLAAPADARPSYYQGVLKANQGNYPEAAQFMERSLTLMDNPATRYSLGIIYIYHLEQKEQGLAQLQTAAQSENLSPDLKELIVTELGNEQ